MLSAVLIIPAALRSQAEAVGATLGWGDANYSIPLVSGEGGVTHYACRADVSPEVIEALEVLAGTRPMPDSPGATLEAMLTIPAATRTPVIEALRVDVSSDLWGAEHARDALARFGLSRADTED